MHIGKKHSDLGLEFCFCEPNDFTKSVRSLKTEAMRWVYNIKLTMTPGLGVYGLRKSVTNLNYKIFKRASEIPHKNNDISNSES